MFAIVEPAGICPGAGVGAVGRRLAPGLFGSHCLSTPVVVVVPGAVTLVGGTVSASVERCATRSLGDAQPAISVASTTATEAIPTRAKVFMGSIPVRRRGRRLAEVDSEAVFEVPGLQPVEGAVGAPPFEQP